MTYDLNADPFGGIYQASGGLCVRPPKGYVPNFMVKRAIFCTLTVDLHGYIYPSLSFCILLFLTPPTGRVGLH